MARNTRAEKSEYRNEVTLRGIVRSTETLKSGISILLDTGVERIPVGVHGPPSKSLLMGSGGGHAIVLKGRIKSVPWVDRFGKTRWHLDIIGTSIEAGDAE